jgi:predicted dehydrogenase
LVGPMTEVSAVTETFVKERRDVASGQMKPVGIDDASAFLARFKNGAIGTFEASRYARGHKALYTLEVNGEKGSLAWDLHDLHRLQWFDHDDESGLRGWRSIHVSDGDQPYMKQWWVPGLQIGYEHSFVHQVADFFSAVAEKKVAGPTFRDALATDQTTDAVLRSAQSREWEKVV